MGASPLFRRGDTVYLTGSAMIGRLESFRVSRVLQLQKDRWVYEIEIHNKPPHRRSVGDRFDMRIPEGTIGYTEDELTTLCDAIQIAITALERQRNSILAKQADLCPTGTGTGTDTPEVVQDPNQPKYAIGDQVYFDASARIGFFHNTTITGIFEAEPQTGSQRTRYRYTVSLGKRARDPIYFREDELVLACDAIPKVLASIDRQLADLQAKSAAHCSS